MLRLHRISYPHFFTFVLCCVLLVVPRMCMAQQGGTSFTLTTFNDALFVQQYHLPRLDVNRVWSATQGAGTIVAVIGRGVDITHEDLTRNIFVNTREIPGNGIDDDNNGEIDDVSGWDFIGNSSTGETGRGLYREDGGVLHPTDRTGTFSAGIIGAVGNNTIGVAGVAPRVQILPIKVFSDDANNVAPYRVADAIQYALSMGAHVIYLAYSQAIAPNQFRADEERAIALALAQGVPVIAPAGDDGVVSPLAFPASYRNVIAVGAVNQQHALLASCNASANTAIYAYGDAIVSTLPNNQYGTMSGTLPAGAQIAGIVALVRTLNPTMSVPAIREQLRVTSLPLVATRIGTTQFLDNTVPPQRSALAFGIASAVSAVSANNPALSSLRTGGIGVSTVQPFVVVSPSGGIAQVVGTGTHTLRLQLRNYLSAMENVSVRLLQADATPLIAVDSAQRAAFTSFASNPIGTAQTADFSVNLTPAAYSVSAEANAVGQLIAEISVNGQIMNYAPIAVPFLPANTGVGTLAIEPIHQLGSVVAGGSAVQQTFRVINVGTTTAVLTGLALSGSNAQDFSIVSALQTPLTLAVSSSAIYRLAFQPRTATLGNRTADLAMTVRTQTGTVATIATQASVVVGTVVAPSVVISDGGGTLVGIVGNSANGALLVRNNSAQPVDVGLQFDAVLSVSQQDAQESEFRFPTQLPTASLRVNAGATQSVPFLFVPAVAGERTTIVSVRVGGVVVARLPLRRTAVASGQLPLFIFNRANTPMGLFPIAEEILALPTQRLGTSVSGTVMVYNPTAQPMTITGVSFAGTNADEFSSPVQFPLTINANDSTQIAIRCTAVRTAEKLVSMTIERGAFHNTLRISASVENPALLSSPRATAEIIRSQNLLSRNLIIGQNVRVGNATRTTLLQQIPATNVGRSSSFALGIRNSSATEQMTLRSVQFAQSDIQLGGTIVFPRTVNAGLIDTLSAVFAPTRIGDIPVQVIATYSVGGSATILSDTAIIAGTGVSANQLVYGGSARNAFVQFPTARLGDQVPAVQAPLVENIGINTATMAVSLSGADARDFVVVRPFPTMNLTVGSNDSLSVVFRPTSVGLKQAQLTLRPQSGAPLVFTLSGRALPALALAVTPRPTVTQTATATDFAMGRVEIGASSTAVLALRADNAIAPMTIALQAGSEFLLRSGNALGTNLTIAPDDLNTILDSVQVVASPINIDTVSAVVTITAENITRTVRVRVQGVPSTRSGFLFNGVSVVSFDTNQVIGVNDARALRIVAQNIRGRIAVTLPTNIGVQIGGTAQFGTVQLLTVPQGTTRLAWDTTLTLVHVPTVPTRMIDSLVFTMTDGTTQIARTSLLLSARARYADGVTQLGSGVFAPIMVNTVASQTVNLVINTVRGSSATVVLARRSTDATFQMVHRGVLTDSVVFRVRQSTASNPMLISTSVTLRFSPTQDGTYSDIVDVTVTSDSVEYTSSIALFGSARPLIQFATPTTGVEFGIVPAGAIRARQVPIQIANMTDTVFVVRSAPTSPFSLSVGEAHRVNQFVIVPDANQSADTLCAVLFEPDEEQRYQDTLNFFQRGQRVFMIVMGGNGSTSTVVSAQTYFETSTLLIAPSIVESGIEPIAYFMAETAQPLVVSILSPLGQTLSRRQIQNVQRGRMTIPLSLSSLSASSLATGLYFVVIEQSGKRYGAKMIVRR